MITWTATTWGDCPAFETMLRSVKVTVVQDISGHWQLMCRHLGLAYYKPLTQGSDGERKAEALRRVRSELWTMIGLIDGAPSLSPPIRQDLMPDDFGEGGG